MAAAVDTIVSVAPSRREDAGEEPFARAEEQRRALWDRVMAIFRHTSLTTDELINVSILADLALFRVFAERNRSVAERMAAWDGAKDFAECAGVYCYALGVDEGRKRAEAEARGGR